MRDEGMHCIRRKIQVEKNEKRTKETKKPGEDPHDNMNLVLIIAGTTLLHLSYCFTFIIVTFK